LLFRKAELATETRLNAAKNVELSGRSFDMMPNYQNLGGISRCLIETYYFRRVENAPLTSHPKIGAGRKENSPLVRSMR
jgi:hypothetical protein